MPFVSTSLSISSTDSRLSGRMSGFDCALNDALTRTPASSCGSIDPTFQNHKPQAERGHHQIFVLMAAPSAFVVTMIGRLKHSLERPVPERRTRANRRANACLVACNCRRPWAAHLALVEPVEQRSQRSLLFAGEITGPAKVSD